MKQDNRPPRMFLGFLPASRQQVANLFHQLQKVLTMNADEIRAVTAKVNKIGEESKNTLAKVAALQTALDNAGVTDPDVASAFAELQTAAQTVDDLVPDPAPEGGAAD